MEVPGLPWAFREDFQDLQTAIDHYHQAAHDAVRTAMMQHASDTQARAPEIFLRVFV